MNKKKLWLFSMILFCICFLLFCTASFELAIYHTCTGKKTSSSTAMLASTTRIFSTTGKIDKEDYTFKVLKQKRETDGYLIEVSFDKVLLKDDFTITIQERKQSLWKLLWKEWRIQWKN